MTLALALSILLSLIGVGVKIWYGARTKQKLKQTEALNEQNNDLLKFLRKEKDFTARLRNDPAFAERVRQDLNTNKE